MKVAMRLLALLIGSAIAIPVFAQPAGPSVQHVMLGISVADIDKMTSWHGDMPGFKN